MAESLSYLYALCIIGFAIALDEEHTVTDQLLAITGLTWLLVYLINALFRWEVVCTHTLITLIRHNAIKR
jgi:hypothetical protein